MDLTSAEGQRPDLPAPGEDLPEIVRSYRSGMTLKEVASSVGMNVSALYSRLRPYGTRRPCGPKLKVRIDLADIERMYRAGRTIAGVARELGVSDSFVYRTLKARRVPIRPPSTALRAKFAPRRSRRCGSMLRAGVPGDRGRAGHSPVHRLQVDQAGYGRDYHRAGTERKRSGADSLFRLACPYPA